MPKNNKEFAYLHNSHKNLHHLYCGLRVALVHDFLVQYGGAERVLEVMAEMFPEATIYTLLYDKGKMAGKFKGKDIRTSNLQKFPKFLRKRYRWLLPFFMVAPETFNLRDYDLVISSSGAWTKGIVTRLNTTHISYIHSPMRFVWELQHNYAKGFFSRLLSSYVRVWDKMAADRPDYLIANSKYTQERIRKYYGKESEVIYPPAFAKASVGKPAIAKERYFLIVSRLSPYKKVDIAIQAFNKLGLPLVIIGEGRERENLEKNAKDNIRITGFVNDEELSEYYSNARALIFPADDDFGMTMVEAMSWGVPVIAFRKGGAKEIVEEGKTGEFFDSQTPEVLADGVRRLIAKENEYDKNAIIQRASEFSKEKFKQKLSEFINKTLQQ